MREPVDAAAIRRFLAALGPAATRDVSLYLAGGGTAVLYGWRETTRDIDLRLDPEDDAVVRRIATLKDELATNVEFASPGDFIPLPPGWQNRSVFVTREGRISVYHLDLYAQALAKLERGHRRDLVDVQAMLARGLVMASRLRDLYGEIEPQLYRFPAVDAVSFRRRVEAIPG